MVQQWRVHFLYLLVLESDAMCRHMQSRFEFESEARIINVLCVVPNPDKFEFELKCNPDKQSLVCNNRGLFFGTLL